MIAYDPKNWIRLILSFHRSDTFRRLLPAMCGMAVYCTLLVYVEIDVWHHTNVSTIAVHSILGFVISLLLVFRTNTAYDRWWEGRRLWGTYVNHTRSISTKIAAYIGKEHKAERERLRTLIGNYIASSRDNLRDKAHPQSMESNEWCNASEFSSADHVPNAILTALVSEIEQLRKKGMLTDFQVLTLNDELRSFAEVHGAAERIKNTPIPYSYSIFIKKIIFIYSITLPFALLKDFGYWTILCTVFVFYSFVSLEVIAEEIENPFGADPNDLPIDEITDKIKHNVNTIFRL
jgi:putative membrane protein